MNDPTYVRSEIDAKPEWKLAFVMSEIMNDHTPHGWGLYICAAKCLLARYDIRLKTEDGTHGVTRPPVHGDEMPATPRERWCRMRGLNPRPSVYKTALRFCDYIDCGEMNLTKSRHCQKCGRAQTAPDAPESRSRIRTNAGTADGERK